MVVGDHGQEVGDADSGYMISSGWKGNEAASQTVYLGCINALPKDQIIRVRLCSHSMPFSSTISGVDCYHAEEKRTVDDGNPTVDYGMLRRFFISCSSSIAIWIADT
jgi:hypothetical protein